MTKTLGTILVVLGIEALAVSLLADRLSYRPGPGFGLYQTTGTVVGVILLVSAFILFRRK